MITYKIPTHDDYYGDCPEGTDFDVWADNIGEYAKKWMSKNYPKIEFEYELVLETISHGNKSTFESDKEEDVLETLENIISRAWPDLYPGN